MTLPLPDPHLPGTASWSDKPAELWRTGAGIGLFMALYITISGLWFMATSSLIGPPPGLPAQKVTLIFLGSFSAGLLALSLMLHVLHGRTLGDLLGPWRIAARQFLQVLVCVGILLALLSALPAPDGLTPQRYLSFGHWLMLLPLSLAAIAVQTSTEELIFRGYIQSRLTTRFASPWAWMVLPSVLFGALHYQGGMGLNGLWFVASAILFGLAASDLTARSGTLGPAMALHFLNNVIALLFVSFGDDLGGLALYHFPVAGNDPALHQLIPVDLATTGVIWLAARVALRR